MVGADGQLSGVRWHLAGAQVRKRNTIWRTNGCRKEDPVKRYGWRCILWIEEPDTPLSFQVRCVSWFLTIQQPRKLQDLLVDYFVDKITQWPHTWAGLEVSLLPSTFLCKILALAQAKHLFIASRSQGATLPVALARLKHYNENNFEYASPYNTLSHIDLKVRVTNYHYNHVFVFHWLFYKPFLPVC
mgnify:CR=1 FL=1